MNLLDFLIFLNERARNAGMSLKERLFLQAIGAIAFTPISKQLAAARAGLDKPSFVSLLERIYTLASGLEVFNSVNESARRLAEFTYRAAIDYLGSGNVSEGDRADDEADTVDAPAEGAVEAARDSLAQFYAAPSDSEKPVAPSAQEEPPNDSSSQHIYGWGV